jgi:uncharacterized protein (TIGR03067 family)
MRNLCLVAGLLVLTSFPARGGDPKKDLEMMQGTWLVESMIERGKKSTDDDAKALEVTIAKDVMTVKERGKKVAEFQLKLDAAKKPKQVDLVYTEGKEKGQTEVGIYDVASDALKFCMHEEGKDRPKDFVSTEKSTFSVIQLKRKK